MALYIFFRDGTFYPLELRDDAEARSNADYNPGTVRVEDIKGRVVWERERPTNTKSLQEKTHLTKF